MKPKGSLLLKVTGIIMVVLGAFSLIVSVIAMPLLAGIENDPATVEALAEFGIKMSDMMDLMIQSIITSVVMVLCGVLALLGSKREDRFFLAIIAMSLSLIEFGVFVALAIAGAPGYDLGSDLIYAVTAVVSSLIFPVMLTLGVILNYVSFKEWKKQRQQFGEV